MAHVDHIVRDSTDAKHDAARHLRRARLALSGGLLAVALTGIAAGLLGFGTPGTVEVVAAALGTIATALAVFAATRDRRD